MMRLVKYGLNRLRGKMLAAVILVGVSPAYAQEAHILALGDSLTQGYGLLEQDGFVPQLRGWLANQGHAVRVVNGGVSGDTTAGGLARLEWSLTPEINGLIVALGGNDLLRGLDPTTSRANIEGILKIAQAHDLQVLLIGMRAPSNYGPDFKAQFDAIYPELAQSYDTLYLDNFFAGLMAQGETPAELAAFMQPDGIHPNAQGVALIVENIGPKVSNLIKRIAP